ncbi:MAG: beta-ketoacyl-[acyl-carrier-protein] synthase family protein [Deltaproteobacteria bacterium]|nr:beta-ketoacyl-[acyl-carrier-protein] synthase family protein [Deltaproteobacteria bacterium]
MKKVVITGMGVISAIGNDVQEFFRNLCEGQSGIREVTIFDCSPYESRIGATVSGIEEKTSAGALTFPRPIQFALSAAREALEFSGVLEKTDPRRIGCFLAGAGCSVFPVEKYYRDYVRGGISAVNRRDLYFVSGDATTNVIADTFHLYGPRNSIFSACSSSGLAIGLAFDLIRMGQVDAMVAGGADGFSEFTFSGFHSLQSVSPSPCKPFDCFRQGLSFGEGAGILILEDEAHARERGASILAEIGSYGMLGEGYNLTAPHPEGIGFVRTMEQAMRSARISAEEVTYVNAHGTATPMNDYVEGNAIQKVFRDKEILVNSIKGLVGHCMGAAGAVEAVSSVLSIQEGVIPGTGNFSEPDPQIPVEVRRETSQQRVNAVLSNSAGFGGNNSSVLFRSYSG